METAFRFAPVPTPPAWLPADLVSAVAEVTGTAERLNAELAEIEAKAGELAAMVLLDPEKALKNLLALNVRRRALAVAEQGYVATRAALAEAIATAGKSRSVEFLHQSNTIAKGIQDTLLEMGIGDKASWQTALNKSKDYAAAEREYSQSTWLASHFALPEADATHAAAAKAGLLALVQ